MVEFTLSLPKECELNLSRTNPHLAYFSLFLSFFFKTHWGRSILYLRTSPATCDRFTATGGSWSKSFASPKSRKSRWSFRGQQRPHRKSHRSIFAGPYDGKHRSGKQTEATRKSVAEWFGPGFGLFWHPVLSFPTRKCWLQGSLWIWVPWKNLWHSFACWNGYVKTMISVFLVAALLYF